MTSFFGQIFANACSALVRQLSKRTLLRPITHDTVAEMQQGTQENAIPVIVHLPRPDILCDVVRELTALYFSFRAQGRFSP